MKTKNIFAAGWVCCCITAALTACSEGDTGLQYNPLIDDPKQPTEEPQEQPQQTADRNELYRPQIHFTPAQNWMNDPNGMVYADGIWHLFYQYNPQGNDWGNMSWGHATSNDLIRWQEQHVALTRDELGAIFSGSAVIDKDNTAGFGAAAMVALYTSASDDNKQQQSLAYSTDGGKTFTRYASNPVIKNDDDNLRDPKVFWHQPSRHWIMALAKGWKRGIEFYASDDLKTWQHQSTFVVDLPGRSNLQWECPDLIQFGNKWVLIVSVNPNGPRIGSGTMYFVGDFDGTTFTADERDYPLWLDYGMDNYAGVTWSNTADRKVMIGWMNNWQYAGAVPCTPWRSAMTLPRELKLIQVNGQDLLASTVVSEIDNIASEWQDITPSTQLSTAYQLRLTIGLDKFTTVTLSNDAAEKFSFDISPSARTLTVHRTAASGVTNFNDFFAIPSIQAPLNTEGDSVTLDIFVDQSSVEIFTQDGSMSMTNLVFPKSIYNALTVTGASCQAKVRMLKSIWK